MGLVYRKKDRDGKAVLVGEEQEEEEAEKEGEGVGDEANEDIEGGDSDEDASDASPQSKQKEEKTQGGAKTGRSSKPVPAGYICMACGGKEGSHWIFDCRIYKEKKAASKPAASASPPKKKPAKQTPSSKVFVSGLPFDVKRVSFVAPRG